MDHAAFLLESVSVLTWFIGLFVTQAFLTLQRRLIKNRSFFLSFATHNTAVSIDDAMPIALLLLHFRGFTSHHLRRSNLLLGLGWTVRQKVEGRLFILAY